MASAKESRLWVKSLNATCYWMPLRCHVGCTYFSPQNETRKTHTVLNWEGNGLCSSYHTGDSPVLFGQWWLMTDVKMAAFCDVASCSLLETDRRFRGACCLYRLHDAFSKPCETSVSLSHTARRSIPQDSPPWDPGTSPKTDMTATLVRSCHDMTPVRGNPQTGQPTPALTMPSQASQRHDANTVARFRTALGHILSGTSSPSVHRKAGSRPRASESGKVPLHFTPLLCHYHHAVTPTLQSSNSNEFAEIIPQWRMALFSRQVCKNVKLVVALGYRLERCLA
jgi:hypothetical protein